MTTQAFPADAVNLFIGTAQDDIAGSMTILMKTNRYYTDNTLLRAKQSYTVTKAWGKIAVENGWAADTNKVLLEKGTPNTRTSWLITGLQPGSSALVRQLNAVTLAAACATAGAYNLPAGDFDCDPFTIAAKVRISGAGASDGWSPVTASPTTAQGIAAGENAATILRFGNSSSSITGDFITVNATGVVFQNFHIQGNSAATAGALVKFGAVGTPADNWKIIDCSMKWGWNQIRAVNGAGWQLRGNFLHGARNNALYVENVSNVDYGDAAIVGNNFVSIYKAAAAIYMKGGGGPKITGNKFVWGSLAFTDYNTYNWIRHIHIDNPNGQTSVLPIVGNSFEVAAKECILIDCSTAGEFHNIAITGNQFSLCGVPLGEPTITVKGRAVAPLHGIVFSANTLLATRGLYFEYVRAGVVGQNSWSQMGGTAPYVDLGPDTGGMDVYPQQSYDSAALQFYFRDTNANTSWKSINTQRGNRLHHYTRDIPNVSSDAVYTDLLQVQIAEYASAVVEIDVACSSSANGQASMSIKRLIANEYQAPTLGIFGADTGIARVAGTTTVQAIGVSTTNPICGDLDLKLTTGNSGDGGGIYVNISVKRSAGAAGTALNGIITLKCTGAIRAVQKQA